jgi:hypothetical protein
VIVSNDKVSDAAAPRTNGSAVNNSLPAGHILNDAQAVNRVLYPNPAISLSDHPPVVLLAMCLFGEARGESEETRAAVAQVVVNRARHAHRVFGSRRGLMFHENVVSVLTRPFQFSCFLTSDVNYVKLFDPLAYEQYSVWANCLTIASEALRSEKLQDTLTHNSDHYFDDSIEPPTWADPAKETVKFGRLRFFRLYLPALHTGSGWAKPRGEGQVASSLPSIPTPLPAASTTTGEASLMSFPAPRTPHFGDAQFGLTRRLGGWELTSLGTATQAQGSRTSNTTATGSEANDA